MIRFFGIFLLFSCTTRSDSNQEDTSETGHVHSVTWHEHVEPLIQKNCAACHNENGVGGVDLTRSDNAIENAQKMAIYTEALVMPPPAADPTCRDYLGSEQMNLNEEEVDLFTNWASAGAPVGSPQSAPDPIDWSSSLEGADISLQVPQAYTISPNSTGNDYRCFVLDNPFEAQTYITGFDVQLDNPSVVHHMLLAIDTGNDAGSDSGDEDLSDGWYCGDSIIEADWSLLHAWTPGQVPVEFEEGSGMAVSPGDQIILQMHYFHPGEDQAVDQSAYRVKTSPSVEKTILMYPYGPYEFTIPAGASEQTEVSSLTNPYGDIEVLGVFPHMHWLGSSFEATISDSSGNPVECLSQGDRYDFDHQATYMFKDPVLWRKGDTVHTSCTWDNSESNPNQYNNPPEDISWGEGTNEEMCFFLFYFTLN